MTQQDILRQLNVIDKCLEAAERDALFKADLPWIAVKIRLLASIPQAVDHSLGAGDYLADLRKLRDRWSRLYFGEALSQSRSHAQSAPEKPPVAAASSPWTLDEEKQFLADLDDLGWFLLSTFGRANPKVNGRWQIQIGKDLYDSEAVRAVYRTATSGTSEEWLWAVAADAVLLSAVDAGFHAANLETLAVDLAAGVHELMAGDASPAVVLWQTVERLIKQGLLHSGAPANCPSRPAIAGILTLTDAGFRRTVEVSNRWRSVSNGAGCAGLTHADDDIPF